MSDMTQEKGADRLELGEEVRLNLGERLLRATLILGFLTFVLVEVWLMVQAWSLMS